MIRFWVLLALPFSPHSSNFVQMEKNDGKIKLDFVNSGQIYLQKCLKSALGVFIEHFQTFFSG